MYKKDRPIFVVALLLGIFLAIAFIIYYKEQQLNEYENYLSQAGEQISQISAYGLTFLKTVVYERGREFLFLFFFSMLPVGKMIQVVYVACVSLRQTVLLWGCFGIYGWKGMGVWLAYGLPQGIFYGLAVYYIICRREYLQELMEVKHPMSKKILPLGVYLCLLLAGMLLEAFLNPALVKWMLLKV
jgi:hypothetical protein